MWLIPNWKWGGAMREEKCRNCGCMLPIQNLLQFRNMPKGAQFFPKKDELEKEAGEDILLKQCPFCGLVQAIGTPVPYYKDVIRATSVSDEMRVFREEQYRKWAKEFDLMGKKIIEIGCGRGEYMAFMERSGAKVYGLEHLQASVEQGRKEGHEIFQGFIENEEYNIPLAPFSGFYTMNFLEHIPEPRTFLRGIANNLIDGAVGIVEVPNFDMIYVKSLYSEFIQDHLSYFTEETLKGILQMNGFEVIKFEKIWNEYILSALVRKRLPISIEGFKRKQTELKAQVEAFLFEQKCMGRQVAVWGAGHQALANLSLLNMSESIIYVIDSAEFKQGRYTPVTHIPIVAPKRLKEKEVQMVIIMAAGYSQEVKQIMDKDYPEIEKVILTEKGIEF